MQGAVTSRGLRQQRLLTAYERMASRPTANSSAWRHDGLNITRVNNTPTDGLRTTVVICVTERAEANAECWQPGLVTP